MHLQCMWMKNQCCKMFTVLGRGEAQATSPAHTNSEVTWMGDFRPYGIHITSWTSQRFSAPQSNEHLAGTNSRGGPTSPSPPANFPTLMLGS